MDKFLLTMEHFLTPASQYQEFSGTSESIYKALNIPSAIVLLKVSFCFLFSPEQPTKELVLQEIV